MSIYKEVSYFFYFRPGISPIISWQPTGNLKPDNVNAVGLSSQSGASALFGVRADMGKIFFFSQSKKQKILLPSTYFQSDLFTSEYTKLNTESYAIHSINHVLLQRIF